ncbi:MAG TPA: SpoIIE family protein phosphatase [Candidatus Ozemobacteraceae bacterium]|mgnify:CR=1 FL=1|nr:SpoIIE family protein phosphatase [Candidatus Ozemobacteraceae bacterium]
MNQSADGQKPRILLVDDEPNILSSYSRILSRSWSVTTAPDGEAGLRVIMDGEPFPVVVSDFRMPRMDGAAFLAKVKEISPETTRIMLTGELDFKVAMQAVNEGNIYRFLTKPCPPELLHSALENGLHQYELIQTEKAAREQEIRIAGEIQKTLLLGKIPAESGGARIASMSLPSQVVDGDFIDFVAYRPDCFDLLVGDVMGKGLHSAMIGAGTKNAFARAIGRLAVEACTTGLCRLPEPERILRRVQEDLGGDLLELGSFATLIYTRFDLAAGTMTWVEAGHTPTLLYSARTGTITQLKGSSPPLGFPQLRPYSQIVQPVGPGDLVLLYSDGFTDRRNADGAFFGVEGLEATLREGHAEAPDLLLQRLFQQVTAFGGDAPFADDLTAILVKL